MPLQVNFSRTEPEQALAVLEDILGPANGGTRLFAAHRRDIIAALAQAGIAPDSPVHTTVAETLAVAEAYEADGMYAFMPTWDLLLSRVFRLAHPSGDDHA
jgi:hypothetical protein